ncbi:hypothetical protein SAY86_028799 [Trapa natans]|uniref:Uncharacterized protein n=1 Tax=Trapa natans TaxID=22666 RepID=A0AAN7RGR4_TRANT|nr:hypothetical protein SAY86_028799 [Trapa natans]
MMNESNQVINAEALSIVPAKRRRGRPRKYQSTDDPNSFPDGGDEFHGSSGYGGSNGSVTGQAVSGFLEGEFDGGYLLTVRVCNSDTLLRGVVFKPGRFVPVAEDNDVAPNVHMIKRNETSLQSEQHCVRSHGGSHSRHRERNGVAYPSAGLVGLKSQVMSPVPIQAVCPADSRGNMAPLLVQPVSSANDGASAGKLDPLHLAPTPSEETQPVALQVVHPVAQPTPWEEQVHESTLLLNQQSKDALEEVETRPVISPPIRFSENLETQLLGGSGTSPQAAADTDTDNSEAVIKSGRAPGGRVGAGEQPTMFIESFHTIQPNLVNPANSENERTGRMTELLQACF